MTVNNTLIFLEDCTRVEVIDEKGRSYVNWKPTNKVRISTQDEGRTLKIFVDSRGVDEKEVV